MALAKEIDCEKDFPKSTEAIILYVLVDLISVIDLCMLPYTQGKKSIYNVWKTIFILVVLLCKFTTGL